jgi:hypothetical protein
MSLAEFPPLIGPDGALLLKPTQVLSQEDANVLRATERLLRRLRLRFAIHCDRCYEQWNFADGCKGADESNERTYVLECRCTRRVAQG